MLKIDREGQIVYYIVFHSYGQLILVPDSHVASDYSLLEGDYGEMVRNKKMKDLSHIAYHYVL